MKAMVNIISGVEGQCLSINNYRVAGPKPWGGGKIIKEWKVETKDIIHAINCGLNPIAKPVKSLSEEIDVLIKFLDTSKPVL